MEKDKNVFEFIKDDETDENEPSCLNVTNNNFFEMKTEFKINHENWIAKN